MKMIKEFILAQAANSIWEHEQNKVMDAIMHAKEKGYCKTEAELVEVSYVMGGISRFRNEYRSSRKYKR